MTKKIVLDIETIPDEAALERYGMHEGSDGQFLPIPFHALACVSLFVVDQNAKGEQTFSLHSYSRERYSERAIISTVERHLSDSFEVLTFNGRDFDLPVLMSRVAITGEYAPTIARLHGQRNGISGKHLDLLDVITGNGSRQKIRLAHLCAAFSIPCKMDGGQVSVFSLAASGDWASLESYCETDVIATYLAHQMWQGAERGTAECALTAWKRLGEWIRANQLNLGHLLPFTSEPSLPGGGRKLGAQCANEYAEVGW